jgi:transposase InsO family protein
LRRYIIYDELKALRKRKQALKGGARYSKKGSSILREGKHVKYAFVKSNQKIFTVTRMCDMMEVSQSAYYNWLKRPESAHSLEDRRQGEKVKKFHKESRGTYGARRIREDMIADGEHISRMRTSRLMKQQGLESKSKRKVKATTNSDHSRPVAANLLDREFRVECPDSAYAGDITDIQTDEGWLYLAVLIDLYSRAVVGWAMSKRMMAQLVDDALMMAVWKRKPPKGLMVHSDRGSQYASELYQKTLKDHEFICSMSRRGNCWDKAPSESFFHTLKTELTHHRRYQSRQEAKQEIFEYIEVFYNRQRRHSTIGYQTPVGYENEYRKVA